MALNVAQASVQITAQTSGEQEVVRLQQRIRELQGAAANFNGTQRQSVVSDRERQYAMRNLGMQVGDLGVQLQTGTSLARAFAMQSGQMAGALAGFGGTLGRVGAFLTGPWGAAILLGVTTLAMFADQLGNNESAMKSVTLASSGLSDAQGVLGQIFDLTTGKIKSQNEMLLLNARIMAVNLRAEAAKQRTAGNDAIDEAGKRSYWIESDIGLRYIGKIRDTVARQTLLDLKAGAISPTEAFKKAKGIDFSKMHMEQSDFYQAISDIASAKAKDQTADLIEKALDTNTLPTAFEKPKTVKTPKPKKVTGPTIEQIDANYSSAFDSITQEDVRVRNEMLTDTKAKFAAQREALATEIEKRRDAVTAAKGYNDAQRASLREAITKLEFDQRALLAAKETDALAHDRNQLAQTDMDGQIEELKLRQDLAGTAADRRAIGLEILNLETALQRIKLEEVINAKTASDTERAIAQKRLDQLNSTEGQRKQQFAKSNMTPVQGYAETLTDSATKFQETWANALKGTEDALVQFAMTGKLSFKGMIDSMIADIVRLAIQQAIMKPLMAAFGLTPLAMGGVISGGVKKFAAGGVVTRPTIFPMAHGMGLMGEAGAEAIMPLRRLGNGRLGVEANGGGTNNVTVNVSVEGGKMSSSGDATGNAAEIGKLVAKAVQVELVQQKRPGGLLAA